MKEEYDLLSEKHFFHSLMWFSAKTAFQKRQKLTQFMSNASAESLASRTSDYQRNKAKPIYILLPPITHSVNLRKLVLSCGPAPVQITSTTNISIIQCGHISEDQNSPLSVCKGSCMASSPDFYMFMLVICEHIVCALSLFLYV